MSALMPVDPTAPADLLDAARAWAADDPDPATRRELEDVMAAVQSGDPAATEDLADRFLGMLEFGTAGLRGALGAGPNRMNRAVVVRAAAGLAAYLRRSDPEPFVVVGYDARFNSDVFARDTASVVVGAGGRAAVLPHPLPTPVLAYAVRFLGADAGVMVTASHNPPQDNGYKVYLADGRQIVTPTDAAIAAEIAAVTSVAAVPMPGEGWQTLGDDVWEAYLDDLCRVVAPDTPRNVTVVHTALHGVGSATVARAFERAGFPRPIPVASQAEPDPTFPTVTFPNPEEPGAMDAALEIAEQTGPDLIIANDPDADRCAVGVPGSGGWRMLHGDELGTLLGWHLLQRAVVGDEECFASSIVSSRLLAALCRQAGIRHEDTLTGFKWIARAPGLRYGYEEALGYCVAPRLVLDKDGVSAALLAAELAGVLKAAGRTLPDVLDELAAAHGVHLTGSFAVRVEDLAVIARIMQRLRAEPLAGAGGVEVDRAEDLLLGQGGLAPTDGLRYYLADDSRVIVRPSGTEPKLKVYLEVIEPVPGHHRSGVRAARDRAASRLAAVTDDVRRACAP